MDVTMEFEVEHQINQPELDLKVMKTCYKEPVIEETYITEEVLMKSQAQNKVRITKEVDHCSRNNSILNRRTSREIKIKISQVMDQVTSLNTTREITNTMVTSPCTKDTSSLEQTRHLIISQESTLVHHLDWNNFSR